jgi:hypothetical protein
VQLTREVPGLAEPLADSAARAGVPLDLGPYDAFHWRSPGPGVYVMPGPGERDQFEALPDDTARSTWFHPHSYGTVTAVIETPMWADERVADGAPHPEPALALKEIAERLRAESAEVTSVLGRARDRLDRGDPRLEALEEWLAIAPGLAAEWDPASGTDMPSMTVARIVALDIAGRRLTLRMAGLLTQLLPDGPERRRAVQLVEQWCLPYGAEARRVPVEAAAAHQERVVLSLFERVVAH